jgi:hypothetical protein
VRLPGQLPGAPSPGDAAHLLRALALMALRSELGGWRCMELAAGVQVVGEEDESTRLPP